MSIKMVMVWMSFLFVQLNNAMDQLLKHYEFSDDGHEWVEVTTYDQAKKFKDKVFAFRYNDGLVPPSSYALSPPILYGSFRHIDAVNYEGEPVNRFMLDHVGSEPRYRYNVALHASFGWKVRLLTMKEVCALQELSKQSHGSLCKIIKNIQGDKKYFHTDSIPSFFKKLGCLMSKERQCAIYNSKNVITLRLIHKKRADSQLSRLPKDVLNIIIKRLIEMELNNEDYLL